MFQEVDSKKLGFRILMGFDGFVDTILKPIRTKTQETTVPFVTLKEFSEYLAEKSGKSCSIDMEMVQEKIGGNMPIVANAIGNLGCKPICIGAMGEPEILAVFENMNSNCSLVSISNPGYCNALEFEDGKLMLATNTAIDSLDYEKLISHVSKEELVKYFNLCDAAAFLNWGEMVCSNDIWEKILAEIIPRCTFDKKKIMLVDFSDFSKKTNDEVIRMMGLLRSYGKYFDITISLNENELNLFLEKIGTEDREKSLEERIAALAKQFPCKNFVVHLLDSSCYVKDNEVYTIEKEVIKEPKLITGGGDNFNAGLLFGLLLGFDIDDAIKVGAAMSCLYVKKGKSVQYEELLKYKF